MAVIVLSSTQDIASTNLKQHLLQHQDLWEEHGMFSDLPVYRFSHNHDIYLVTISDRKIFHNHLDQEINTHLHLTPTQVIVLSRHRSQKATPSLTVHPVGNFGEADLGGLPQKLVPSSPRMMTHLLRLIKHHHSHTSLPHHVCFEVTHHGPYLETPTVFVEIGSTETEWKKPGPAKIITLSLLDLLQTYPSEQAFPKDIPVLVGIGGGHYTPRFTDVIFERNAAFGHMIPKYHISAGNINGEMLNQAIAMTPGVKAVYFDKHAIRKSQLSEYRQWCKDQDIPVVSSKTLPMLP
jgi:D-aminoacyl-tRNA deacylase